MKIYNQGQAFNDITQGDNGYYEATQGWDACTGLGSPDGVQLYNQLSGLITPARKKVPTLDNVLDEVKGLEKEVKDLEERLTAIGSR